MIYRVLHIIFWLFFSFLWGNLSAQNSPSSEIEQVVKEVQRRNSSPHNAEFNSDSVREVNLSDIETRYDYLVYNEDEEKSLLAYLFDIISNYLRFDFKDFQNEFHRNDFIRGLYIIFFLTIMFIATRLILKHKGRWFLDKSDTLFYNENEENIEKIKVESFIELIKKYENEANFQQSVRLYYLWILKIFSEENHIKWHIEKTNSDYIREITNPQLKSDFQQLSYLYNYVWYGKFTVDKAQYIQIKNQFEKYTNPKK